MNSEIAGSPFNSITGHSIDLKYPKAVLSPSHVTITLTLSGKNFGSQNATFAFWFERPSEKFGSQNLSIPSKIRRIFASLTI